MKILIADPDWNFLNQAREYLEPMGHLVVHETNAQAAAARAEQWKPDVIMVSVEFPECTEGDLLATFQNLHPRPAVVLTSQLENFAEAWRAWQHGGDELVVKPILHGSELHVALLVAMKNVHTPRQRNTAAPMAKTA